VRNFLNLKDGYMPFPYKDIKKALPFMKEFIERTKTDPVLFDSWRNLKTLIGIRLKNPDMEFTLDCTSGTDIKVIEGYPEKPGIGFTVSCDNFHKIYTGKLNPMQALFRRMWKLDGSLVKATKLMTTLPNAIKLYKELLKEKGLPEYSYS
jgi:putative sterol carrier protein